MEQPNQNRICNVCYRCRVYVSISDDPLGKQRLIVFSQFHKDHPHGFNPNINLSRYRCINSEIESLIQL